MQTPVTWLQILAWGSVHPQRSPVEELWKALKPNKRCDGVGAVASIRTALSRNIIEQTFVAESVLLLWLTLNNTNFQNPAEFSKFVVLKALTAWTESDSLGLERTCDVLFSFS